MINQRGNQEAFAIISLTLKKEGSVFLVADIGSLYGNVLLEEKS